MNKNHHLNLIPLPIQRRSTAIRESRRWIWIMLFTGLIGNGHAATLMYKQQTLNAQLSEIEIQVEPVLKFTQECRERKQKLKEIEAEIIEFENLGWTPSTLHLLGVVATSAADRSDPIQITSFNYQCHRQRAAQKKTNKRVSDESPEYTGLVSTRFYINGTATGDQAISRFLSQLRGTAVFEQLELKSAKNIERNGQTLRDFQIEGQLLLEESK